MGRIFMIDEIQYKAESSDIRAMGLFLFCVQCSRGTARRAPTRTQEY